ncbi:MAG: hypothetical protein LLG04_02335 [Parachlamydia sp.]|nr:hypothetical protein [Parachlamydia sp.]
MHAFILSPGKWVGEGKISFSASAEHLHFYTRWLIGEADTGSITCSQEVEMPGNETKMFNHFVFSNVTAASFAVELENDILGKVQGKGIIDAKTLAWEFHGGEGLEGFEVYELQDNGDYMLHAEYASPDQFRTVIDGRIWKKTE